MKILLLSDLHHEHYLQAEMAIPEIEVPEDVDVIALLGDIDSAERAANWAVELSQSAQRPVLFVPGNHEFYGYTVTDALQLMREITKGTGVTLLHDDFAVIEGTLFIGATLWTSQALGSLDDNIAQRMSDYHEIQVDGAISLRKLTTQDTLEMHERSLDFIESILEREHPGEVVVLTHHAPHPKSLSEHYIQRKLEAAYASDLSYLFEDYKIDAWLHGHVHTPCDYKLHNSRVAASPRGYYAGAEAVVGNGMAIDVGAKGSLPTRQLTS